MLCTDRDVEVAIDRRPGAIVRADPVHEHQSARAILPQAIEPTIDTRQGLHDAARVFAARRHTVACREVAAACPSRSGRWRAPSIRWSTSSPRMGSRPYQFGGTAHQVRILGRVLEDGYADAFSLTLRGQGHGAVAERCRANRAYDTSSLVAELSDFLEPVRAIRRARAQAASRSSSRSALSQAYARAAQAHGGDLREQPAARRRRACRRGGAGPNLLLRPRCSCTAWLAGLLGGALLGLATLGSDIGAAAGAAAGAVSMLLSCAGIALSGQSGRARRMQIVPADAHTHSL